MKKPIVYLQSAFWEKLSANYSREGIRTMLNVSDAMSNSHVITDVTEEEVLHDDFLKFIIKQESYQRCDEQYIDKRIANLKVSTETDDLCATFLIDKNVVECKNIENSFGVIILNATTVVERQYLFKGDGFCLDKTIRYDKRYLTFKDKLSHPCNSLIVIDPYILKERHEEQGYVTYPGIDNNLESLLDAILPQKLFIEFHLTIISSLSNPNEIKRVYEKIKKCLKRIRKDLNIRFGMFYTETGYYHKIESFHSRHVLSNTLSIDSEDGLDLFNSKGYLTKNNPSLSVVFPRLFGNSRQDMSKYYHWISSVKKYIEKEVGERYYGSKENRLFDLID